MIPITSLKSWFWTLPCWALAVFALSVAGICAAAPIVDMGLLDTKPKPLSTPEPDYPAGYKESGERGMVVLELLIDEGGRVVGSTVIASTDGRLAAACMTATAKWRYEAGVKGGHAVYSRMRVSFSFGPEGGQERAEGPFVTPVVVYQEQPVYPFSLRLSGIKGKVVVEFIVDPQGNVIQPSVIESSHPDFEAPTIEALLNSKFKPGLKNGHPVFTRMEVPILFQIAYNDGRNGVEAWSIPGKASSSLPEPYRYEEPPRPLLIGAPVYSYELLTKKVRGKTVVGWGPGRRCSRGSKCWGSVRPGSQSSPGPVPVPRVCVRAEFFPLPRRPPLYGFDHSSHAKDQEVHCQALQVDGPRQTDAPYSRLPPPAIGQVHEAEAPCHQGQAR